MPALFDCILNIFSIKSRMAAKEGHDSAITFAIFVKFYPLLLYSDLQSAFICLDLSPISFRVLNDFALMGKFNPHSPTTASALCYLFWFLVRLSFDCCNSNVKRIWYYCLFIAVFRQRAAMLYSILRMTTLVIYLSILASRM